MHLWEWKWLSGGLARAVSGVHNSVLGSVETALPSREVLVRRADPGCRGQGYTTLEGDYPGGGPGRLAEGEGPRRGHKALGDRGWGWYRDALT